MRPRTSHAALAAIVTPLVGLSVAVHSQATPSRGPSHGESPASLVEADVSLSGTREGLAANGSIFIAQTLVQRMIERGLAGSDRIVDARVSHEAETDTYRISGSLDVPGPDLPIEIRVRLETDDSRVVLRFLSTSGLGPDAWYERPVVEGFAYALRSQGVPCEDAPDTPTIVIGLDDFLHGAGLVPRMARVDEKATRVVLGRNAAGDLTFHLSAEREGPRALTTGASDLAVRLDGDGVGAIVASALAPDYRVTSVSLADRKVDIHGQARWRGIEDASSGLELLATLLGDKSRWRSELGAGQAWIGLDLSIRQDGERLVVTSSHDKATVALDRALTERHVPHVLERSPKVRVTLAVADLVDPRLGRVTELTIGPHGIVARGHADASAALGR